MAEMQSRLSKGPSRSHWSDELSLSRQPSYEQVAPTEEGVSAPPARPPTLAQARMGWSSKLVVTDQSATKRRLNAAQKRMQEHTALDERLTAEPALLAIRPFATSAVGPGSGCAGTASSSGAADPGVWSTTSLGAEAVDPRQRLLDSAVERSHTKVTTTPPSTSAPAAAPRIALVKFASTEFVGATGLSAGDGQMAFEPRRKWRVASHTATIFSRRAAAGLLTTEEEPLDYEESVTIAKLVRGDTQVAEPRPGALQA
jgi:hypothetical protein